MGPEDIEVRLESAEEIDSGLKAELKLWTDEVFGRIAYQWAPPEVVRDRSHRGTSRRRP